MGKGKDNRPRTRRKMTYLEKKRRQEKREEDHKREEEMDDPNTGDTSLGFVMREYLQSIQGRLKTELRKDREALNAASKWLLSYLANHEFWIRAEASQEVCKKLGMLYKHRAYYRDVRVWLPEVQYGEYYMPSCVTCNSNSCVARHTCFKKSPARYVVGISRGYDIMTWQYICHTCEKRHSAKKKESIQNGVNFVSPGQYTFMGYNSTVLTTMPDGIGDDFPAILSYRSGLDKVVHRLMRPLFDRGIRPEGFSEILLELHSLQYTDDYLKHERILRRKKFFTRDHDAAAMFSTFNNKKLYAGYVPTGRYLLGAYKKYVASIKDHLDREVKKRGCRRLHVDGNAKIPKLLCRYNGFPLFKSLMTGTNEYREVRLCAFSVTEAHDQLEPAVLAMVQTMDNYGQQKIELATTDNAPRDHSFLVEKVPSLKGTQDQLDHYAQDLNNRRQETPNDAAQGTASQCSQHSVPHNNPPPQASNHFNRGDQESMVRLSCKTHRVDCRPNYKVQSSVTGINDSCQAIRDLVILSEDHRKVLALDIEYDTTKNSNGWVTKAHKTALMQIGFQEASGMISCHMYQVFKMDKLPDRLVALFQDQRFTFVGSFVSGDLKRIGSDFGLEALMSTVKYINLGKYARERDIVPTGSVGLEVLCSKVLGEVMDKSPGVRLSKWSNPSLSEEQKIYAALDAIKSLEIYFELEKMPNLNARLSSGDVKEGLEVDVVPSHGNAMDLATRAAVGIVTGIHQYRSAESLSPRLVTINCERSCVVMITKVLSPNLVVPGLKRNGQKICLGDFGEPPFNIPLPLGMLRDHIESNAIRTFVGKPLHIDSTPRITRPSPRQHNAGCAEQVHEANELDVSQEEVPYMDEDGELLTDGHDGDPNEAQQLEEMDTAQLNAIQEALVLGETSNSTSFEMSNFLCEHLDDPPEEIQDCFKAVIGDNFHQQKRPRVPVRHPYKKAYFVALMRAFLAWNDATLLEVKAKLREKEWSEKEIEKKMYFQPSFFQARVDRVVPPPSKLYWRVRAVYVKFGSKMDHKGKPLFNRDAWRKANSVLKEILGGFASDPPTFPMYTTKLQKNGQPMIDEYGITHLECSRGTNDVENWHKQLRSTFGTWQIGIEMTFYMLAERRHRHNQRMSELHRSGFPIIGHYDSWKIDLLQLLVEDNHGVRLYPYWVNSGDWKETDESFDLVAMHDCQLQEEVLKVEIAEETVAAFPSDLKFLSRKMGIRIPFLPVIGKDPERLFGQLIRALDGKFDDQKMAVEWCRHIDGINIFPTLPVYLRIYHEHFLRGRRAEDACRDMQDETAALEKLNQTSLAEAVKEMEEVYCGVEWAGVDDGEEEPQNERVAAAPFSPFWPTINLPGPLLNPRPEAIRTLNEGALVVGGTLIGLSNPVLLLPRPATRGPSKTANKKRKRSCQVCKKAGRESDMHDCAGRGGARFCPHTTM